MDLYRNRKERVQLGVPLLLLQSAYAAISALASGSIHYRQSYVTRTNAPLEYWFTVFSWMVVTIAGTSLAILFRESIWGSWESIRRKVFEGASLFCYLLIVYAMYLSMHFKTITNAPDQPQPDALLHSLVALCIMSALPLAVLAYCDKEWHSSDAAPVCAIAWVAVCACFSCNCQVCAFGLAATFVPFILSAIIAHALGVLCRFIQSGELKASFGRQVSS
jgi:hypothetical protein